MEEINFLPGLTTHFLVGLGLSFLAGFVIGLERESKGLQVLVPNASSSEDQ